MLYIIKSTLIIGILLAVYHLFLEKEKMHRFNRFYLLSGLVLAFVTPLITVGYIQVSIIEEGSGLMPMVLKEVSQIGPTSTETTIQGSTILNFLYCTVAIGFLIRFLINLTHLVNKTIKNDKIMFRGFTLVLIHEQVLPHTFFNYVFINKEDYYTNELEDQLFTHELTHAQQIHSLDIMLIELIQIVFWFNPLILFYKKAIQLNHEFLADEQVVNIHGNIKEYQHLLVDKAGNNNTIYLASNLNFSVTKKRLKMMNRTSNRWRKSLYAASTFPLFICLLLLLGNQAYAQSSETNNESIEGSLDMHLKTATIIWKTEAPNLLYQPYEKLSPSQKAKIKSLVPPPPPPNEDRAAGSYKEVAPFPKNSILEFDVVKNSLTLVKNLNNIPSSPPSPLEKATDMKKNGGTFILNNESVDASKAISVLSDAGIQKRVSIIDKTTGSEMTIITNK